MNVVQILVAVSAGVVLLLFSMEQFSREVQAISGVAFRKFLARSTRHPLLGFLIGGAVTALIQSSTATSVLAVGLVNAGVLSFRNTLGILFGTNVGTTVTAQLVAYQLTDFGPVFILTGFVVGLLPFRSKILGRSIFYFGFVFFSLNLVASAVTPLRGHPALVGLLAQANSSLLGVLVGAAFTAVVQSSSVTTGVVIILMQQGILSFEAGLPIALGANVGTTVTALVSSVFFDASARRAAVSHLLYNVCGVALVLPFLGQFRGLLEGFSLSPDRALATAHLLFNLGCAGLFLLLIRPFAALVEKLVPDEGASEPIEPPPQVLDEDNDRALTESRAWVGALVRRLEPCYTACVLALETRDRKIENRATRMAAILGFGVDEGQVLAGNLARRKLTSDQSTRVLRLVVTLDHIRQFSDSFEDLMVIGHQLARRAERFSVEALLDIQRVYPLMARLLDVLTASFDAPEANTEALKQLNADLQDVLAQCYRRFIEWVGREHAGSELAHFLSVHQRLRSKVSAFFEHLEEA